VPFGRSELLRYYDAPGYTCGLWLVTGPARTALHLDGEGP
jgi:hypothetical protein